METLTLPLDEISIGPELQLRLCAVIDTPLLEYNSSPTTPPEVEDELELDEELEDDELELEELLDEFESLHTSPVTVGTAAVDEPFVPCTPKETL